MEWKSSALKAHKFTIFTVLVLSLFLLFIIFQKVFVSTDKERLEKPNIILLTVCTLRADHLGIYDYPFSTSPNIDRLARKSMVFQYAFCPIPKTSASFASMMTGLHPFVHKTRPNLSPLKSGNITLAEALRMLGYENHAVVDNGNLSKKFQFAQGFDKYTQVWEEIDNKSQSTRFITDHCIQFLKQRDDDQGPFFLWLNYIEPHAPYVPPSRFVEERESGRDIRTIRRKVIVGTPHERSLLSNHHNEGHYLALYDGAVRYVDHQIGKIIRTFFKEEMDRNTVFIISADHGEDLGEKNFFFDHGPLTFNASTRVPLIIYFPDKEPRVIPRPVSIMDIYPTLLHMLGLNPHRTIQGLDLLSESRHTHLHVFGLKGFSVITSRGEQFVYINEDFSARLDQPSRSFYDIYTDPHNSANTISRNGILSLELEKTFWEYFNKYNYLQSTPDSKKNVTDGLSKKELQNLKTLGYIK